MLRLERLLNRQKPTKQNKPRPSKGPPVGKVMAALLDGETPTIGDVAKGKYANDVQGKIHQFLTDTKGSSLRLIFGDCLNFPYGIFGVEKIERKNPLINYSWHRLGYDTEDMIWAIQKALIEHSTFESRTCKQAFVLKGPLPGHNEKFLQTWNAQQTHLYQALEELWICCNEPIGVFIEGQRGSADGSTEFIAIKQKKYWRDMVVDLSQCLKYY